MDSDRPLSSMKHLLQFSSAGPKPWVLSRVSGQMEERELEGEQYFSLSPTRACVGYKDDVGWKACINHAVNAKQCPACQYKDVARVYTVGDFSLYPQLHGQLAAEKYVIYLAQFGADITKVGLTRRSRVRSRWREQGADFAVELLEFDGPDHAYPAEELLMNRFDVVGAVRATQKIKRVHFDAAKARARLEGTLARIKAEFSSQPAWAEGEVVDLSAHYPRVENPEVVDFVGGEVMGAKGAWLFYAGPSGQHYAVDMHAAVGRFMLPRATAAGVESGQGVDAMQTRL